MKRQIPSTLASRLSPGQVEALFQYSELLETKGVELGLVGEGDAGRSFERHVVDSLRAVVAFREQDRRAADLGSGAGLPGLVLALALPDRRFTLVESRARRVAFLEVAVERLGLANVTVSHARGEDVTGGFDVVTARAFAPLAQSWAAAWRLLAPGGRLVYFAGVGLEDADRVAARLTAPARPAEVAVDPVLESSSPLVIMSRG